MIEIDLEEDLRTVSIQQNGVSLCTDGPKEFQGKGEYYSPTDLLALSLGSCILTVMAMAAKRAHFDLKVTKAFVEKEMAKTGHRRISKILVQIKSSSEPAPEVREKLEKAAFTCPVHSSLHPEIEQTITFLWGVSP